MIMAVALMLQAAWTPPEPGPICGELESQIEPDFHRYEADITADAYRRAIDFLREEYPAWLEGSAERIREGSNEELIGWESWMARTNRFNLIHAYVLKLEALSAPSERRDEAVGAFCEFLATTPIID